MPRRLQLPQAQRGFVHAAIPELVPTVHSALECMNLPPNRTPHLTAGSLWMLIYFFDAALITIERPGLRPLPCARHTAILILPGTRYTVDTRPTKSLSRHIWMAMDGLHLTGVMAMIATSHTSCLRFDDTHKILASHMENLIESSVLAMPNVFWPAHLHGRRILSLLESAEPVAESAYRIEKNAPSSGVDPIVVRVVAYLQGHLGERIRLAALARHLHSSPSSVSHRYRAAAGESPMQTLNRLRLLQAKIRLVRGDTVENIALDLGFYDAKHLANTFRKAEGIPPSAFVRIARVNQDRR